jgi:hypothetical protein
MTARFLVTLQTLLGFYYGRVFDAGEAGEENTATISGELTGSQFPKPWWTRIDNPGMPISQTKNNRLNTASAVILLTRVIAKYFIR